MSPASKVEPVELHCRRFLSFKVRVRVRVRVVQQQMARLIPQIFLNSFFVHKGQCCGLSTG